MNNVTKEMVIAAIENNEYAKSAKLFLEYCNSECHIKYMGKDIANWDERRNERDFYYATIKTPHNTMSVKFFDSIINTQNNDKLFFRNRKRIYPTAYDIITCLHKYEVGSIEDFMFEYGYTIEKKGDFEKVVEIYNACKNEYENLCKCFTSKEIELMQNIR